jgi:hypothetical protein
MTDLAIRVEQLGKSYRIGHQAGGQRGRYRTLRDDLLVVLRFLGKVFGLQPNIL